MNKRRKLYKATVIPSLLLVAALLAGACGTPTPVVQTVRETVVVESTTVVEVESTTVVERVVTPTPQPVADLTQQDGPVSMQIGISHGPCFCPVHIEVNWRETQARPLMYPGLTNYGPGDSAVLDLATDYQVSADGLTHTFSLPPEAVWSDGTPLTSADVLYSYELALTPEINSTYSGRLQSIRGAAEFASGAAETVAGITAPDEHTVVFELEAPDVTFQLKTTMGIVPKHIYEAIPFDQLVNRTAEFLQNPTVVSGPYQFVQYVNDEYLELEVNPNYWGEKPQIERLLMKHVDWAVVPAQLEAGELSLSFVLNLADVPRLEQQPHLTTQSVPSGQVCALKVNTSRPYLNQAVRQAFAYAIDAAAVGQASHSGYIEPAHSPFLGPEWAINPNLNPYDRDLDKARELLAEGGWDPNRQLDLVLVTGLDAWRLGAQVIQAQLAEVGVLANLRIVAGGARDPIMQEGSYDVEFGCYGEFRADPALVGLQFATGGSQSLHTRWSNPRVDEIFVEAVATSDQATRQQLYWEAAAIMNEELPYISLYSPQNVIAYNKGLNVSPANSYAYITWDIQNWALGQGSGR